MSKRLPIARESPPRGHPVPPWLWLVHVRGGVRGKYAKSYHAGTNLVLLEPDVRKAFRDEKAVNEALRLVIELRKIGRS